METVIVASSPVSGQCCAILCGAPNLFRQVQRFLFSHPILAADSVLTYQNKGD
jgi:hypothetical protein